MAGDWIKMRADLQTHPKVVRIMSALRADKLRVVGGLHAVWCLFDVHSEDGQLDGYTAEALDNIIGWPGFTEAMEAVSWIEVGEGFLSMPRFDEHNGKSAKRRATETQRKREERAQPVRTVSANDADKLRSREEKRREDSSSLRSEEVSGPARKAAPPSPATPPPPFDGQNAEALNGRHVVALSPSFELPDDWGEDAERLGWKPAEILDQAERYRQYWTVGKGQGTRRNVKGWRQTWSNWLAKAAEYRR